jgi:hypothetical protein
MSAKQPNTPAPREQQPPKSDVSSGGKTPPFDLAAYMKKSTKKSGVPLRLNNKSVLRELARLLK